MIWKSNNGKNYKIPEMDTGHIQNCIIKLIEKIEACDKLELGEFQYLGRTGYSWIWHFKNELEHRGVIKHNYTTRNYVN